MACPKFPRLLNLLKQPIYTYYVGSILLAIICAAWIFHVLFVTEEEYEPNVRTAVSLSIVLQTLNGLDEVYVSTKMVAYTQSQWFYLVTYLTISYFMPPFDYIWIQIIFIAQVLRSQQDFGFLKLKQLKKAFNLNSAPTKSEKPVTPSTLKPPSS